MAGINLGAVYTPSAWQQKFHLRNEDEVLGGGAAGGGKSYCLRMHPFTTVAIEHHRAMREPIQGASDELNQLILDNPIQWGESVGWVLYLRRTRPMLKKTLALAHSDFKKIDPDVRWVNDDHTFIFKSGFRYEFGHCQHANDWINYQSAEFHLILWDELSQFTEEQYQQICSRCRTDDPVLERYMGVRGMSNPCMPADDAPTTEDPYWLRRLFVDPYPTGNKVLRIRVGTNRDGTPKYLRRIFLPARLDDNPNKKFVEQYMKTLDGRPAHIRKAMRDGDWYVRPGAFFHEAWDPARCVIRPFRVPEHWKFFRAMDWGYTSDGIIGWFAMNEDGDLFMIREYVFSKRTAREVGRDVADFETKMLPRMFKRGRSLIRGPADTQLWEKRGETSLSKVEEFRQEGVDWDQADKSAGSRRRQSELLYTRLLGHEQAVPQPRIFFFDSCIKTIQTIPTVGTDKNDPTVPVTGGYDHPLDMVRYAVGFASKGLIGIPSLDERKHDNTPVRKRPRRGSGATYGIYG